MITKITPTILEDNPWMKLRKEFSGLQNDELIYVALVADFMSPFRLLPEEARMREAQKCVVGRDYHKDKAIKTAINAYMQLCPRKQKIIKEALEGYYEQFESITKQLAYGKAITSQKASKEDLEDNLKIQAQCNTMIKDGTQKKVWEQIEFYEKLLSYQYEIPEDVQVSKNSGKSINDVTPSKLRKVG